MNEEEMRYRVTAEVRSVYQLIVEATSPEEAEAFSDDIDWEKWQYIESGYKVVDVAKDFFERKLKVKQDTEFTTSNEGPTLRIVKG